ncbi:MAG: putative 2-aminoethylphosphonate ABC transporter ATP-binding protein [Dongiaceae bacterium]
MADLHLSLRNITKRFGSVVALDSIELEIPQSEFICFLGPSGCGKTTLLRIIAGLEIPDGGELLFRGEDLTRIPERLRNFGMVFQSYSLFPNLTVGENIAYGLDCRGWKKADKEDRVVEMIDLVRLSDHRHKYQHQLSGGEQQRVALARALAPRPNLLLLDEPLSALDAKVRRALREEIRGLQQELGVTTIMVTHDQEEALAMADRIAVIQAGHVVQIGAPAEIYRDPQTSFVADFIGSMNFLNATAADGGRVRLGGVELACDNWIAPRIAGSRVSLAIRPENVRIDRAAPGAGANRLPATVRWVEFLGNGCRVELLLDVEANPPLQADVSPNMVRELGIERGSRLLATLPPDALRAFSA